MLDLIHPKVKKIITKIQQTSDDNFIGFDKYIKKGAYCWEELADNKYSQAKVGVVSSYLYKGRSCLDIVCGDGAYAAFSASQCRFVLGIDADYQAIRLAKSQALQEQITNCSLYRFLLIKQTSTTLVFG